MADMDKIKKDWTNKHKQYVERERVVQEIMRLEMRGEQAMTNEKRSSSL